VNSNPSKRGFSLLEILLILAVLGILLGISGFLLSGYLRQQRLNEATRVLGETLRHVAELATTQSQEFTLTFSSTTITWQNEDAVSNNQVLPNSTTLTAPISTIKFSGRGLPETGGAFSVSLNSETRTVYLSPTGAVIYP
jgi:prepilin-type N-terminal cleavage/methylation domain-containing protein